MRRGRGSDFFPDARFDDDPHLGCPDCASRERWACAIVEAWLWTRGGRGLADIVTKPSAAVVEGVLLLEAESGAMEARQLRDRARR